MFVYFFLIWHCTVLNFHELESIKHIYNVWFCKVEYFSDDMISSLWPAVGWLPKIMILKCWCIVFFFLIFTLYLGVVFAIWVHRTWPALVQTASYNLNQCCLTFNSSPLNKMAAILQMIFLDAFSWLKSFVFWLKFQWSLFLRVQLAINQHWFR